MNRCFSCFKEYEDGFDICPHCGAVKDDRPAEPIHLYPGTVLAGRYILGKAVGSGGFGIIYRAWDSKLETIVAVKEFFAGRLMTRAPGKSEVIVINKKASTEFEYRKERFLAEARTMAKFGNHKSIPNVFEFFEENGTAYIVMELLSGMALNRYLRENGGKVEQDFAIHIANEIGKALISMHSQGIVHRDVAPDNIYICSDKELRIKLLDLGAAKLADSTDEVIDIILKPGYSPVEQYDNSKGIGPWTDVYALGATLYVMLTGVKPDESTNRKISDTVLPPHEIDESIPENLSNAVMKAMAIERHMRFRNVSDFLKAINGEKKVLSLAKEKKLRKRRRFTGIAAAVVILAVVAGFVLDSYKSKRSEQIIDEASITVWFSVADGSDEVTAVESMLNDFQEKQPGVTINVTAIPESEYADKISAAASSGKLPTLFESTGLSDDVLRGAEDIEGVLNSPMAQDCLFLDQYSRYYSNYKKIPLAIEVPVAAVITGGAKSIAYEERFFSSVDDFGTDAEIAADGDYLDLLSKDYSTDMPHDKTDFMNNEENKASVMLSSTMEINEVMDTLTNYKKEFVYPKNDKIHCRFIYEWSIGDGTEAEKRAGELLLSWMLGTPYQTMLMISRASDGQIPVNKAAFYEKCGQSNLAPIKDIYGSFVFER